MRTVFCLLVAGAFAGFTLPLIAADATNPAPVITDTQTTAVAQPAPVRLPYGVDDVLKLSRAQVSEDVIVNYVQNSGTVYNLAPKDILYLRNEGMSDRVINAMLEQRRKLADTSTQSAPVPAAPAVTSAPPPSPPADANAQATTPAPVYVQPPPPDPPASSVYVIPYPAARAAYYGYAAPYYYPYYYGGPHYRPYCYGPSISFGFRFGGGHYWHHGHW